MLDSAFRAIGKIPGALMVVPLFLGALVNTFAPGILDIGSFTTALFRDGTAVLIGLFFLAVGSQISLKTVLLQSWAESSEDSVSHSLMAAACGRSQAVSKTRLTITASGSSPNFATAPLMTVMNGFFPRPLITWQYC